MTQPFFLAIEGPIGVGKTTLARLLQPRFEAELLLEAFEENPFLSDFYTDRARYAFQTQIFFLLSRYRQQQSIRECLACGPLIADYVFAKDSLFAHLTLDGDEVNMYELLHGALADRIPAPDLVIHLRASTDVLMMRIATRDRSYERKMDLDYINTLRHAYDQYFSTYAATPLLTIDTNDLNYVQDAGALDFVEGQVRTALGLGAYQRPLLPVDEIGSLAPPERQAESRPPASRRDALEAYLAVSAAVGRVGAVLSDGADEWSEKQSAELEMTIGAVAARLNRLALASGIGITEELS